MHQDVRALIGRTHLTTVWAYFLLRESLDVGQLLGGALIVGSVASLQLDGRVFWSSPARRSATAGESDASSSDLETDASFESRPVVE